MNNYADIIPAAGFSGFVPNRDSFAFQHTFLKITVVCTDEPWL